MAGLLDDRILDAYCSERIGPKEFSIKFECSLPEVKKVIQSALSDAAFIHAYLPYRRVSRQGMRFTENENRLIQRHQEKGISTEDTARMLMRKPNEVLPDYKGQISIERMKQVAPRVDVLLACRYLYWCTKKKVISDQAYDEAKAEEIEFGGGSDMLTRSASNKVVDYPPHIRSLAFYMLYKEMVRTGKWEPDVLPAGWAEGRK